MHGKLIAILEVIFLPLLLAVLFALQNIFFNKWLGIYSKVYSARLFWVCFALGIILYGPATLFKRRFKYWYLFLISFIISLLFVAQFLYYRYSQSFLQFSAIRYIWQAPSVAGTVKTLVNPELFLFISNFLFVLISFIIRKKFTEFVLPNWQKLVIIVSMVAVIFFGYRYLIYTEKKEWGSASRLYTDVYDLKALVGKMGIANFFLEDTFKYVLRSSLITDADRNFLKTFAKNRTSSSTSGKYLNEAKGKNLIIIQVESLENAVINQTIGGQEITPNLNQLASNGLYFNNFYAQIGHGNTADAEFVTMNSLYPLPDDVVFIDYAKNTYKALPQLLVKSGYKTYSMHGDVPTFWNRSNIYPGLGYQRAYDLNDYIVTRPVGKGPSDLGDEDLFSQSLPRLEGFKTPFMATLITMSLHTPFVLPPDLQTLNIPAQTNLTQNQWEYLQAAHYTDKAIGEFINGLKKDGLYDKSLILIWGDHGSLTGISSALGQKNILPELQNSQVPLIILNSGVASQTINEPASQLDIYPTITNLLGIPAPKSILGQDLLNTASPVETHFEIISGGIDAILTDKLAYEADEDGILANGSCLSMPDRKFLAISDCQAIYTHQASNLRASNIIIRGNLLSAISK